MNANFENRALLGTGVYSIPEASRLIDAPQGVIRNWLGYGRNSSPLWVPDFHGIGEYLEISFLDLMEIRVVHTLRKEGLSLQYIRKALQKAGEEFDLEHPFSTGRFRTDGKRIFWETAKELAEHDPDLEDLLSGQFVFWPIVEKTFKSVDIEQGLARRWWPQQGKRTIVVDPHRSFGQPILAESGIPTRRIWEMAQSNQSENTIALYFEISKKRVCEAIKFEEKLLH